MLDNYWKINAVSNSELTALAKAYNAIPDNREELEDIFNFGSLVDAMLSEPWKVDHIHKTLLQDDGTVIHYDTEIYRQAYTLSTACRKDPLIAAIVKHMTGQYIVVRTMQIQYEADEFSLRCKCKFDAYGKRYKMGADYKTTSCKSQKQFREAIDFFHWDRQGAFYMDLGRIDRHWIIGISKATGEIFKHAIERGDTTYTAGRDKYSRWAFLYKLLDLESFANHSRNIKLSI